MLKNIHFRAGEEFLDLLGELFLEDFWFLGGDFFRMGFVLFLLFDLGGVFGGVLLVGFVVLLVLVGVFFTDLSNIYLDFERVFVDFSVCRRTCFCGYFSGIETGENDIFYLDLEFMRFKEGL